MIKKSIGAIQSNQYCLSGNASNDSNNFCLKNPNSIGYVIVSNNRYIIPYPHDAKTLASPGKILAFIYFAEIFNMFEYA